MKARRIVRPKRSGSLTASSAIASNPMSGINLTGGASNPFAGINLVNPSKNAFSQASKPGEQVHSLRQAVMHSLHASISAVDDVQAPPGIAAAPKQSTEAQAAQPASNNAIVASSPKGAQQTAIQPENPGQQPVTSGQEAGTNGKPADQAAPTAASGFSSFLSANKEKPPFAVKAGRETSAFGNGTSDVTGFGSSGFSSTAGGFGQLSGTGFGTTGGAFGALGRALV